MLLAAACPALLAAAALLAGLDARALGAAATPLWTVNFTGHGSSESDATLTIDGGCPSTDHTTVKSAYHWSVTWEHVALSTPPVTGNIITLVATPPRSIPRPPTRSPPRTSSRCRS